MTNACVIGWPISHSRSPIIHGYWLRQHGLDGSYTRMPVEPKQLSSFLSDLDKNNFAGCNVTIPHKEATFGLVAVLDEATERLGAVNTVYLKNGRAIGMNTDGEGFLNNVRASIPNLSLNNTRAVILGAGGASMAIIGALLLSGVTEIAVSNRSIEKAKALRKRFGKSVIPIEWEKRSDCLSECDLLVNTTSLGMTGQTPLEINLTYLPTKAIVSDIVYTPLKTRLLIEASALGHPTIGGLGMLLHQAVRGFELWFGVRPTVSQELFDLVARDVDPEYQP